MSNRAIAGALGVDEGTVRNDQSTAENSAVEDAPALGLDGRVRRRPQRRPADSPSTTEIDPEVFKRRLAMQENLLRNLRTTELA